MTTEELYEILGDIDERCVKEAREYSIPKKRIWRKWRAIVACLCLLVVGTVISVSVLREANTRPNDVQGSIVAPPENNSSKSDEHEMPVNKPDGTTGTDIASSEAGVGIQDEITRILINVVKQPITLDIDVRLTSLSEQTSNSWSSVIEDFHKFTGITYEDFTGKIPDSLEQCGFYSVSSRGYSESGSLGEYTLHDYVFDYQAQNGGSAKIAVCSSEAPLRDCLIFCDNPEKSVINGVSMEIYAYQDTVMAQFSYNGINYDIETSNMTQDGLVELLTCIIG